jgi:WD40 repeat protein
LCRFFILYNFIYGQINIFNASTLSLINSFKTSPKAQGYPIYRIYQSPFNNDVVITSGLILINNQQYCEILVWNTSPPTNWTLSKSYFGHRLMVYGLEFINSETIVTGGVWDRTLKIWSSRTGENLRTSYIDTNLVSLQLFNNRTQLAVGIGLGGYDIYIFNVNDLPGKVITP